MLDGIDGSYVKINNLCNETAMGLYPTDVNHCNDIRGGIHTEATIVVKRGLRPDIRGGIHTEATILVTMGCRDPTDATLL